ncbi:MAG: thiamine diphosphokinase [Phascolarctobacterium sp.]
MREALEIALPEVKLLFHVKQGNAKLTERDAMFHVKRAEKVWTNLLIAGGRAPRKEWLQNVAADKTVYCADKGAIYALAAGISPTLVVGDCDSTSKAVYDKAQCLGAKLEIHQPAKDDTDLQLLLARMPEGDLLATGIWGGRFDHLFSNVYSLLAFKEQRHCQVILADEQEFMVLLTENESWEIELHAVENVQALSLLPLSGTSTVSIKGVRWPLDKAKLEQQNPYAISNEALEKSISCTCHEGKIGLYIHWQTK